MTQSAASVFGGLTAIHFLKRLASVKPDEKVLINGASGAVGSAAVQVAKSLGANVIGVSSEPNLDLVHSLGADKAIDYTKSALFAEADSYDVILDAVGNLSWQKAGNRLSEGGRLILLAADPAEWLGSTLNPIRNTRRIITGVTENSREDLSELRGAIVQKAFDPVIDQVTDLPQIRAAHQRVDTNAKRGSIVIDLSQSQVIR